MDENEKHDASKISPNQKGRLKIICSASVIIDKKNLRKNPASKHIFTKLRMYFHFLNNFQYTKLEQ